MVTINKDVHRSHRNQNICSTTNFTGNTGLDPGVTLRYGEGCAHGAAQPLALVRNLLELLIAQGILSEGQMEPVGGAAWPRNVLFTIGQELKVNFLKCSNASQYKTQTLTVGVARRSSLVSWGTMLLLAPCWCCGPAGKGEAGEVLRGAEDARAVTGLGRGPDLLPVPCHQLAVLPHPCWAQAPAPPRTQSSTSALASSVASEDSGFHRGVRGRGEGWDTPHPRHPSLSVARAGTGI